MCLKITFPANSELGSNYKSVLFIIHFYVSHNKYSHIKLWIFVHSYSEQNCGMKLISQHSKYHRLMKGAPIKRLTTEKCAMTFISDQTHNFQTVGDNVDKKN